MEIKWYQLLFQVVNFGILVWALNRWLYRPMIKIIDQRNKKIEDSIKAAEANLKEKETIAQLKIQAIAEAEKEAVQILDRAKQAAQATGKQMLSEAQKEAEQAIGKRMRLVNETISQEEKRLTAKISGLVIATTKQVLKTSLGAEAQRRIIDRQIKQLEKIK